jgi:hypothetical protein
MFIVSREFLALKRKLGELEQGENGGRTVKGRQGQVLQNVREYRSLPLPAELLMDDTSTLSTYNPKWE